MAKLKIVSDPYNRRIDFMLYDFKENGWVALETQNPDSKLRQENIDKVFLPFKAMETVNIILEEYYAGNEKVEIVFQGTTDEWEEMETICLSEGYRDKVELTCDGFFKENARDILDSTKNVFDEVSPIIKNIFREDDSSDEAKVIRQEMKKVSDSLDDIIPICIFGNYSAGKSTFINALIGNEILPSGGDPVTAKVYEIKQSKQLDRSVVAFTYNKTEEYRILFDLKECRIQEGNKDSDIAKEILERASDSQYKSMLARVRGVVDLLNSIEKRAKEITIGDVIKIEVPFSDHGKLGQSHNEFVIFDTPGSNSASNIDHLQVLQTALNDFSNGIPVWVTQYDSIDSTDNKNLCDMLYKIDALDKRFTMIVINKADSADLPRNGLSEEDVANIHEYDSVSRMYAAGIYFVSSIMGLGAKKPEEMESDYLWEVYEEKERKFSDPTARAYKKLYEYNIMPIQMKSIAVDYSQACDNLVYANSGLYCVETEMEQFASKYAAYNKCRSAYVFLESITNKTKEKIESKTSILEKRKKKQETELNVQQRELIEKVRGKTRGLLDEYQKESKTSIRKYAKSELKYDLSENEVKDRDEKLSDENFVDSNFKFHEDAYEWAKNKRLENLRANFRNALKKGTIADSVKSIGDSIKTGVADWRSDSKLMNEKKEFMEAAQREIEKRTSDEIFKSVIETFKQSRADAYEKLSTYSERFWKDHSEKYKEEMIKLIATSDSLTEDEKADASEKVTEYQSLNYDDAEKVFSKPKFLKGNVLGVHVIDTERLNTDKLVEKYNHEINRVIEKMTYEVNHECFVGFEKWQSKLRSMVEANIASLNPSLRELTLSIQEDEGRITDLKTDQKRIVSAVDKINNLMEWKNQ